MKNVINMITGSKTTEKVMLSTVTQDEMDFQEGVKILEQGRKPAMMGFVKVAGGFMVLAVVLVVGLANLMTM